MEGEQEASFFTHSATVVSGVMMIIIKLRLFGSVDVDKYCLPDVGDKRLN